MIVRRSVAASLLAAAAAAVWQALPANTPATRVAWNDNTDPAGELADGRLTLELDIVEGDWHVVGEDQPPGRVYAFAERGVGASIPGPLIRVDRGTLVSVTLTNQVDSTIVIRGLGARRNGLAGPLTLEPGQTRTVEFRADAAGTYYYWGSMSAGGFNQRAFEDSQLTGALIVDDPGARREDRVLVIGIWADGRLPNGAPDLGREFLVINGRPWPHTERLTYALGDSVRWRLINASYDAHAMHLHGFFYRVEAKGDLRRDTVYWKDQQRMAVTEHIPPGGTMSIAWSPHRPGGWIFHCHMSSHVTPNVRMDRRVSEQERFSPLFTEAHHEAGDHATEGMGGLMMGLYVEPPPGWVPDEPKRRELRLFVQSRAADGGRSGRQFAYVLQEGPEPAPDSVRLPGSPLILRKGEPTAITVVNRTEEATQVHWHGLEIESYYDGVAGLGGYPGMPTPAIPPGGSWEMRITPERAGTFMYHSHMSDLRQQGSGLYGPFIVLDEDETWDPDTDRLFIFGESPFRQDVVPVLNGENPTAPATMEVGKRYRLRFMQITLDRPNTRILLTKDGSPVRWVPRAHDGFDLPQVQRRPQLADRRIAVGETFDFEYTPTTPGDLRVEFRTGGGVLLVDQLIRVTPADR